MANTIQFKRRQAGNAGAPAALKSGEVAHNEVDDTLYVGKGDDGAGNATSIIPLSGRGAFVDLTGARIVLDQEVWRGEVVLFAARVTLVCLSDRGAVRLPAPIRAALIRAAPTG